MPTQKVSLPAVTTVGVIAIIFSVFGVLGSLIASLGILLIPNLQTHTGPAFPREVRVMTEAMMLFMVALCVFGIFVGVGVLRRRNWARITMLVWGGIMAFFGLAIVAFSLVIFNAGTGVNMPNSNGVDPAQIMRITRIFMIIFYGLPAGIGIWWVVLFTRPRVAEAFTNPAPLVPYPPVIDASGFPQPTVQVAAPIQKRPSCPLPLAVLAGFFLLGAVSILLFPFMPQYADLPALFFGHAFSGAAAKFVYILLGVISGVTAAGIFKLKPWALHTQIALQFFGLLNCTVTFLSPAYLPTMRAAMAKVYSQNPFLAGTTPYFSDTYFRSIMIFGMVMIVVVLAIFLWQRPRFLEQAAAAAKA
jgi:hypothetical protein